MLVAVPLLAVITSCATALVPASPTQLELRRLVTPAEERFLMEELARIDPPTRITRLTSLAAVQRRLGGGFHGALPEPLDGPEAIPIPVDHAARLRAALFLARQREAAREALRALRVPYPLTFSGDEPPDLDRRDPPGRIRLTLDLSVPVRFLAALRDGQVTRDEAVKIAALPANREMLRHRRALDYLPGPKPDRSELAELIRRAGSDEPLDRLWAWLNPCNDLGYADLASDPEQWTEFVVRLARLRHPLEAEVARRVAAYAPENARLDATFALTVGCLIRGWSTGEMAGLDLEQVKDDWGLLLGTMTEETYHRLELVLCPTSTGGHAAEFEGLASASTGDPRLDHLYEVLAYTVLEGAANLARGPRPGITGAGQAAAGRGLLDEITATLLDDGDLVRGEALLGRGLRGNGPLYAEGFALADAIAAARGPHAVGEALRKGPVAFVLEAASTPGGEALLTPRTLTAVGRLQRALDDAARNREFMLLTGPGAGLP